MITSENLGHIAKAIAAAQAELKNPPRNKTNPHFNSKYVDLVDGLNSIRETFSKHGLAFVQGTRFEDEVVVLDTRIIHTSGEWISSSYPVCRPDKPQVMGSALTYARRYAAFCMAGFAGEDDDDGNMAQEAKEAPRKAVKAPPPLPKQTIVPGMMPEDSEKALKVLLMAMETCTSIADLQNFSKENSETITKLTPKDKDSLRSVYSEMQVDMAANADA
jgi:hypothetical protein